MQDSYLSLYGKKAEKLLSDLEVGEKVTLTVKAQITELSMRDSMSCCVGPGSKAEKPSTEYCVRAEIVSVSKSADKETGEGD